jgi:hypothetical protein
VTATVEQATEQLLGPGWETLHPYKKWQGAHWRLVSLVELGARRDQRALDMLDHVLAWLIEPRRLSAVKVIEGRARRCASQEGNAVFAAATLGEADSVGLLVDELIDWQWPDGGWNCDRRPSAGHSSFHETVWPLRGLLRYHEAVGGAPAWDAAQRAAEFLLRHRLFRSERTGEVIDRTWLDMHWPPYWHYDVLQGLRAVVAAGQADREEAAEAFAWLEDRQRDGAWTPSGRRYWRAPGSASGAEVVDWTGLSDVILTAQARDVLAHRS